MNQRLVEFVKQHLLENPNGLEKSHLDTLLNSPEWNQRVLNRVEALKIELSTNLTATLKIPLVLISTNDRHYKPPRPTQQTSLDLVVSRRDFESVCADLFARVLHPIRSVMEFASLAPSEVHQVILVGGSTRIPRVRETISAFFGGRELNTRVDPDLAIVTGAAIQAGIMGNSWPLRVAALDAPTTVSKIRL